MSPQVYYPAQEAERLAFARRAADYFADHADCYTYTDDGKVRDDSLFAVRWGVVKSPAPACAVLIFKIDETRIYGNMDHDLDQRNAERGR